MSSHRVQHIVLHGFAMILTALALFVLISASDSRAASPTNAATDTSNVTQSLSVSLNATTINRAKNYTPRSISAPYVRGAGVAPAVSEDVAMTLARLGYAQNDVWRSGMRIVGHTGLVQKNCGAASGYLEVSGVAIKPTVTYASCPDGEPVIPDSYKTPGKCTVHFDATNHTASTARGNSAAVLAHEMGHCLYFMYGESQGLLQDYLLVRPVKNLEIHQIREVFADDFMQCRHGADTAWDDDSYYAKNSITEPTAEACGQLNALYSAYFPI